MLGGRKAKGPPNKELNTGGITLTPYCATLWKNDTEKTRTRSPTVMKMIEWLDNIGIEASESQVRRDIHEALKSGPLLEW